MAQAVKSDRQAPSDTSRTATPPRAGLPVAQVGREPTAASPDLSERQRHRLHRPRHPSPRGATGNDLPLTFDYTANDGYPITLVTYEIVCATPTKNAALLKDFLTYTAGSGQGDPAGRQRLCPRFPTAIQTKVADRGGSML